MNPSALLFSQNFRFEILESLLGGWKGFFHPVEVLFSFPTCKLINWYSKTSRDGATSQKIMLHCHFFLKARTHGATLPAT